MRTLVNITLLLALLVVPVVVFAEDPPQFLMSWGISGTNDGQLRNPDYLTVDPEGNILVVDDGTFRVSKFTSTGLFLENAVYGHGLFQWPAGIATSGSMNFVVDSDGKKVVRVGTDTLTFGSFGSGDGQFLHPFGTAIGPDGLLYVADDGKIEIFTLDGSFIKNLPGPPSPAGLAIDGQGNIYVVTRSTDPPMVSKYAPNGSLLASWGTFAHGRGPGQFLSPNGIAVDTKGRVYVVDTGNFRVQIFDANGVYLSNFGSGGSGDGQFNDPRGVAVDTDGFIYVTDHDRQSPRVEKFGYVPSPVHPTTWGGIKALYR